MRRLTELAITAIVLVLLIAMFALHADAWDGAGYGDCDGWWVTNPKASWNSPEWEMVAFPVGLVIGYGETKFVPPSTDEETERTFQLAWRLIDDGDNYQHSATLKLSRDLTECTPTSTTEAPPSSTTTTPTTEPSPSTTSTTDPSTTTPPTSSPTTTKPPTSTSSTTSPAPTITADTTSSTSSPASTPPESTSDTLPHTGVGAAPLAGLAGLGGMVGLWLIGRRGDE